MKNRLNKLGKGQVEFRLINKDELKTIIGGHEEDKGGLIIK